jgi:hypothetical protein
MSKEIGAIVANHENPISGSAVLRALRFDRQVYLTLGIPSAHFFTLDITLPFEAVSLKGGRFLNKPLPKYRIHRKK